MMNTYNYDFSKNSFYGEQVPENMDQVYRHLIFCALNMYNLNGSTFGEVVDCYEPTHRLKLINYRQ